MGSAAWSIATRPTIIVGGIIISITATSDHDHDQAHAGRRIRRQTPRAESACGYNFVEQRKHSSMTSHIVDCMSLTGRPIEGFVPKFESGIEVMGELVSRRDYGTQRTPLNCSR